MNCSVSNCSRKARTWGYCGSHYAWSRLHKGAVPTHALRSPGEFHGKSNDLLYKNWTGMKQRCYNPKNPVYKFYGGRGVTVCDEWRDSYQAFYAYMGPRPNKGMSIDRVDPDKGYEPGNVRWATKQTQTRNRRKNKNNLSGKTGVHWNNREQRWCAELFVGGKRVYSRTFMEKEKQLWLVKFWRIYILPPQIQVT